MNSDEARRTLVLRIAEADRDAGIGGAEATAAELEAHQLAALRVVGCAPRDAPLFQLLAIDGIDDTVAAGKGAEDAELAARVAGETFDRPCLIGIVSVRSERCDAGEHPIADAGGRRLILFAFDDEDARGDSVLL